VKTGTQCDHKWVTIPDLDKRTGGRECLRCGMPEKEAVKETSLAKQAREAAGAAYFSPIKAPERDVYALGFEAGAKWAFDRAADFVAEDEGELNRDMCLSLKVKHLWMSESGGDNG
jgi:hypothetical protein